MTPKRVVHRRTDDGVACGALGRLVKTTDPSKVTCHFCKVIGVVTIRRTSEVTTET